MNIKRYYHILRPGIIDPSTPEGRSKDRYRRAAWTSITDATAKGIAILTGLISVPLTINYLGAERFGLWMTIMAMVTLVQHADFGIANGVLNKIAEASGREDNEKIRVLISNGMALCTVIAVLIVGVFYIINTFVSWSAVFNATSPIAISEAGATTAVLVIIFALNIVSVIVLKVNIALQRGYINGIWQISGSLMGLLFLIISIKSKAGLPLLVASYMSGPLLATIANGIFFFFHTHKWAKPSLKLLDLTVVRSIGNLGIWFFLFQIIVSLNNAVPNIVISHILGLDQVAIFAITLRLASVAVLLQSVILAPLWPAYAESKTRGDWVWVKKTFQKSMKLSGAIGLFAAAVIVLFGADIIKLWVGANTVPPQSVLWGFGAWVLLSSLCGPISMFMTGLGKVKIQAIYGILFSSIMIIATVVFSRLFHLAGTAWAFGVAFNLPYIAVIGLISYKIVTKKDHSVIS